MGEKNWFVIVNTNPPPVPDKAIAVGMVAEHIYRIINVGPGGLAVNSTRRGGLVILTAGDTCDVQTQPPEDLHIAITGGDFVVGTFERLD